MEKMNWGIIGPGKIAHVFARDLRLVKTAQTITAVLGIDEKSLNDFVREFNTQSVYTELNKFIRHPALDIVYIASPQLAAGHFLVYHVTAASQ